MKQRLIHELATTISQVSPLPFRRVYEGLIQSLSSCSLADIHAIHHSIKEANYNGVND